MIPAPWTAATVGPPLGHAVTACRGMRNPAGRAIPAAVLKTHQVRPFARPCPPFRPRGPADSRHRVGLLTLGLGHCPPSRGHLRPAGRPSCPTRSPQWLDDNDLSPGGTVVRHPRTGKRPITAAGPSRIHTGVPCLPVGATAPPGHPDRNGSLRPGWALSISEAFRPHRRRAFVNLSRWRRLHQPDPDGRTGPRHPLCPTPINRTDCPTVIVSRVSKNTSGSFKPISPVDRYPLCPPGHHCARRATRGRQQPEDDSSHGLARQACRGSVRGSHSSG